MGDRISAGPGAMVINRSLLIEALNRVGQRRGKDAAELLERLSQEVEESGDQEAKDLFESFSKELLEPQPKKPVLTSLWDGLQKTLPALAKIAEAAGGIAKLFA